MVTSLNLTAGILAFVILAVCIAAPMMLRDKPKLPEPDYGDLEPLSKPWSRKTTDEG
jgi:hypothetical protein